MPTKIEIQDHLESILKREAINAYVASNGKNVRNYSCSVSNCEGKAYAKGFCNAHYIRSRNGGDMSEPIRARHHGKTCAICPNPAGGNGGWGLCKKHYRGRRRNLIRAESIKFMGGKCTHCGGVFPDAAFDFHHLDSSEKELHPSDMIESTSIERLASELAKCILLCANCHRIEHHGSQ